MRPWAIDWLPTLVLLYYNIDGTFITGLMCTVGYMRVQVPANVS